MDLTERVFADAQTVFPKFPAYWAKHGPDFFEASGGHTAGSVFLVLARLVQERAKRMSAGHWRRLAGVARMLAKGEGEQRGNAWSPKQVTASRPQFATCSQLNGLG
jgi:hypothetical protein